MKGKQFVKILILVLIISTMPVLAHAAYIPPTSVGAPKSVAVEYREDGFEKIWIGFDVNVSASNELRDFVDAIGEDNSAFSEAGYGGFELMAQIDYKLDEGNWHYKSEWDEDRGYNTNKSICRIEKGSYTSSVVFDEGQFESISSGESLPVNKSYFDTHTMYFRVRFVVNYQDENGEYFGFFSPWSETVSYSNNQKIENPDMLINHVPALKSAEIKKHSDGSPYLNIRADKAHEETQLLNNISNDWVKTEVWLKVNNGEWKACHSDKFVEEFNIGAEAYFGLKNNYEATVYEIKFRYSFDYNNYPAAGKSGVIYSPFSNIITHGMDAYSIASSWAMPELDKANEYGLIPTSLKGEDMTKPITREEFAEVAILLYEKATGRMGVPITPNPFNDTTNPQILKAFNIGIVKGISTTSFAPNDLTNREQVATMLSRAIRCIVPDGDFSTNDSPSFSDQKDISSWAMEHVQYMAKLEIIKGADGKFMPKAVTSAQTAAGYATTTREHALAMSVRSFDNMDKIKDSKPDSASTSLVGTWEHAAASGNVGLYISLDLKRDGTFSKTVGTSVSYSVSGMRYTGNYSISGDKILFYNQKKGTVSGSSLTDMNFNPSIEDVPVADTEETFFLNDKHHMMLGDTEFFRSE